MPAHFGPIEMSEAEVLYPQSTTIAISYATDRRLLAQRLPPGFELPGEARLTAYYSRYENVPWLAGGDYNVVGVNAAVRYRAGETSLEGELCLALWENHAIAIMYGRELLGIPKIYAEIDDHRICDGKWQASAGLNGRPIVDLDAAELTAATEFQLADVCARTAESHWFGWRYVPRLGRSGSDLSHATVVLVGAKPDRLWYGRGRVEWHHVTWEDNPTQYHICQGLRDLPVIGPPAASVSIGSTWLHTWGAGTRALR